MAGYFSKTNFTPSTSNTYTVSFWVKINNFSPTNSDVPYLWSISSSNTSGLFFQADTLPRNICFFRSNGSTRSVPTNNMRDVNAWYHIHLKVSSGTGTLYYNGESVKTSITVDAQNYGGGGAEHYVHTYGGGLSSYDNLDCVMSHFHFVDGTAYDPTVFGSTDATTGEWKINTSPSVTYGNNGFFILKDGNSVTDQSGEGNDFTVAGGTLTNTQDCPSNNFCTINPLSSHSAITLSKGNTQVDYSTSAENGKGNLAFSSGKFYWEAKLSAVNSNYPMIGIGSVDEAQMQKPSGGSYPGGFTNSYGIYGNGNVYANGSNTGSQSFTYTTNDYIGIAVDLDSGTKTIKWFKNGSQIATYNITTTAPFAPMDYSGSGSDELVYNFGNGAFGTTQLTGTTYQGSGNLGIFKYQPPSGYTALCTTGLNE